MGMFDDNIIAEINGLAPDFKALLLVELFDKDVLDFPAVAAAYIKVLERRNKKMSGSLNTLALMLASYCITDSTPAGKNARKHLYNSGAYTENDGSPFGQMLAEEFKNDPVDILSQLNR